jgi:CPA2 family monovalent cation:H+ antiporter-2
MELGFLKDLVLVFGVSAISILVLSRIKVPPMVSFIVAGVLIGPSGFGIIKDVHEIEVLAEIGVILLLFTIGIEFSLKKLMRIRNVVLFSGGGQVLLTTIATMLMFYMYLKDLKVSLFFGFLAALSSTAIVLKTLEEKGAVDSQHGRLMLGVLIFQDLCIVPLMLVVPMLAGDSFNIKEFSLMSIKALGIIATVLLSARWLVPHILHLVVSTRRRELFIITVIFICLGTALLTSHFGLSLALGAFLAGLVISESEYAYQATAEILPFKESFLGLFFVSIGMLIDIPFFLDNWFRILAALFFILALKSSTTIASLLATSSGVKASIHAGIGLAQIGEFSFILAEAGKMAGIFPEDLFQVFLASAILSMMLTPLLHTAAPYISSWASGRKPLKHLRLTEREEGAGQEIFDHVIIVGFGLNGRNLAHTLRNAGIKYVILDLNSVTVRKEKVKGEPIYYGDASSREVLFKLGFQRARALVVAISDPVATRRIVSVARSENPSVYILVRTRYQAEIEELNSLGADTVIPEEFETSVEIFSQVLNHYNIPSNLIHDQISDIRRNRYEALRSYDVPRKSLIERQEAMSGIETENYQIRKGSPFAGMTLAETDLRGITGATLMAVERDGAFIQNPKPDFSFKESDILLFVGKHDDISRAVHFFEGNEPPPKPSSRDDLYNTP